MTHTCDVMNVCHLDNVMLSFPQFIKTEGAGFRRTYGGRGVVYIIEASDKTWRTCEAAREPSGIKSCDIFISDQT